jgi:junctophilin
VLISAGLEKLRQMPKYRPTIEPIPTKAQLQQQQQQLLEQQELQAKVASAVPPSMQQQQQNQHQATPPRPAPAAQQPPPAPASYQPHYTAPPPARAPSIPPEPPEAYRPQVNNLAAAAEQNGEVAAARMGATVRRGVGSQMAAPGGSDNPAYSFQQAMSDHFDHYKRAPSRDSSVDRYTRATRMSRQPSAETPSIAAAAGLAAAAGAGSATPQRGRTPFGREGSVDPSKRVLMSQASTEKVPPSNGSVIGGDQFGVQQPPFEDIIMKKKSLGQDIIPSLGNPKRTESLFVKKEPVPKAAKVGTRFF